MYKVKGVEYPCCTSVTMGIIGGKWKTVILAHLTIDGTLRYSELRKKMKGVTERTLSLQLKALQEAGVINRKVYTSKPPLKVEYSLTEFGETLVPLINAIIDWGEMVIDNYSDE
ncbi:winged helix-turn-helix transcriptional regulator [Saprospira grandis]|uniref:HxlR family transcriptional regulator n=2 Tax=Saprospira grandis TaxID=1008 RepID=H6L7L7_SAPGL|nr:winged helix-turn-helix transcriptional regulator [Saprospira grandis]AFC23049.1 HxlR family transcriptional regulator [Saprospira grandis str. Lewin]EJF51950.1 putative transcriptional regulator [Saprospira grandis DSM 2844]WBM74836.1 winged helix-turn-helix transcriptional regulator [Saprospira grandis]